MTCQILCSELGQFDEELGQFAKVTWSICQSSSCSSFINYINILDLF